MPANEVFLDTLALAAYINSDDHRHIAVREITVELAESGTHLVTTEAILTETSNLLISRLGLKGRDCAIRAINYVLRLQMEGIAEIIYVDPALWWSAWELLKQRVDKAWGLTDCISFVVMQDRGIKAAFTADRHFEQAGFKCLLKKG